MKMNSIPVPPLHHRLHDRLHWFKKTKMVRETVHVFNFGELIVPKLQPFPNIENVVLKSGNCRWFLTFEINLAFWSIVCQKSFTGISKDIIWQKKWARSITIQNIGFINENFYTRCERCVRATKLELLDQLENCQRLIQRANHLKTYLLYDTIDRFPVNNLTKVLVLFSL